MPFCPINDLYRRGNECARVLRRHIDSPHNVTQRRTKDSKKRKTDRAIFFSRPSILGVNLMHQVVWSHEKSFWNSFRFAIKQGLLEKRDWRDSKKCFTKRKKIVFFYLLIALHTSWMQIGREKMQFEECIKIPLKSLKPYFFRCCCTCCTLPHFQRRKEKKKKGSGHFYWADLIGPGEEVFESSWRGSCHSLFFCHQQKPLKFRNFTRKMKKSIFSCLGTEYKRPIFSVFGQHAGKDFGVGNRRLQTKEQLLPLFSSIPPIPWNQFQWIFHHFANVIFFSTFPENFCLITKKKVVPMTNPFWRSGE